MPKKPFLLTHPVWDVTSSLDDGISIPLISTHTSRVGCDMETLLREFLLQQISTHTSRVGCDKKLGRWTSRLKNFYSHIPCGM